MNRGINNGNNIKSEILKKSQKEINVKSFQQGMNTINEQTKNKEF